MAGPGAGAANDLITVLLADHRELERMLDELQGAVPAQHPRHLEQLTAALMRHAVAEEQHLYPLVRRALRDGDARADRELGEHAEVERVLRELEQLGGDDPAYQTLVGQLISEVRNHLQEEEHELLPRLTREVPAEQLRELGGKVRRAKESAPTRPRTC